MAEKSPRDLATEAGAACVNPGIHECGLPLGSSNRLGPQIGQPSSRHTVERETERESEEKRRRKKEVETNKGWKQKGGVTERGGDKKR